MKLRGGLSYTPLEDHCSLVVNRYCLAAALTESVSLQCRIEHVVLTERSRTSSPNNSSHHNNNNIVVGSCDGARAICRLAKNVFTSHFAPLRNTRARPGKRFVNFFGTCNTCRGQVALLLPLLPTCSFPYIMPAVGRNTKMQQWLNYRVRVTLHDGRIMVVVISR